MSCHLFIHLSFICHLFEPSSLFVIPTILGTGLHVLLSTLHEVISFFTSAVSCFGMLTSKYQKKPHIKGDVPADGSHLFFYFSFFMILVVS